MSYTPLRFALLIVAPFFAVEIAFSTVPSMGGVAFLLTQKSGQSPEITAERSANGVVVKIDGRLFTEYLEKSGTKPVLWPIIGPTGKPMTRDYPIRNRDGEKQDHLHHRSMWFTHGNVNGIDFWAEQSKTAKLGTIRHIQFAKIESGKPAVIVAQSAWIAPDGKKVCEDQRTLRFDADDSARWIDFDIVLKATDGEVTFGDTKEGTFGLRMAESMKVDARQGGKIINSRGQSNEAAWGRPAEWVDYYGPVDGQTVGIAIFNHPKSFRFPTPWHVRTYGLFAANPFGLHDFPDGKKSDGTLKLRAGETITLCYRVLFHRGDQREGRVSDRYAEYAKEAR
jgi:hypothetical protein